MAPSPIRQLLVWSLPSVAVLLSYLWYKKRRIGVRSDTGGSKPIEEEFVENKSVDSLPLDSISRLEPEKIRANSTPSVTPAKSFNRSLSGVETTPIDIVYPRELKASKATPMNISDEDLDLEIEKIKSMRNQYNTPSVITANLSKVSSSPKSEVDVAHSTPGSQDTPISKSTSPNSSPIKKEPFEHCAVSVKKSVNHTITTPTKITPNKAKGKNKEKKHQEKSPVKKMAHKDVKVVEEKMTSLKVSDAVKESPKKVFPVSSEKTSELDKSDEHHEISRKNSGRDSANHSPSDVMMASPSLSSMSDNHSEGSSDSGKGGSDMATPPPSRTPQPTINANSRTSYEFVIPQSLVGKLIGRQGSFVQGIKDKCNAHVYVRRHPTNNRLKLCSIEGNQSEIEKALQIIRDKFPLRKYAEVTLEQVQLTPVQSTVPLIPESCYLKLVEGINNDTILSCMVSPNHLFMQLPTHPSFPSLSLLSTCMNNCYSAADSPLLPHPIPENTVCAAYSIDSWCRATVLSSDEETDTSYVKFLDYGGFAYVENDKLRQIRHDFMLLPFQATECFLANVKSKNEDGSWPEGAYELVADITKGSIIYTQIADFTPEGIPLVLCYVVPNHREYIFLNQKLIEEGYADWAPLPYELELQSATVTDTLDETEKLPSAVVA